MIVILCLHTDEHTSSQSEILTVFISIECYTGIIS